MVSSGNARKGTTTEGALIFIVLFGLVIIFLAILYTTLYDVGNKEFSKRECQTSLLLTRATQEKIDSWASVLCFTLAKNPIPLKCSRRFLTVTADDVLANGESVKFQYNPSCDPEVQLLDAAGREGGVDYSQACLEENVLAKEMTSCWNMFFQGEVPVFQQVEQDLQTVFNAEGNDRVCFVCAEVMLRTGEDITDFRKYLTEKKQVGGTSYYDYLAKNRLAFCSPEIRVKSDDGTCWAGLGGKIDSLFNGDPWPGVSQDVLPDGKTYAITFIRYGMSPTCEEDEIPTMTVQVLPAENINEYCHAVIA